jgi:uncharacterized protein YyaL (SSP411 family)
VSLDHLRRISEERGVVQHCVCSSPDPATGFCVDDNARALITAAMHYEQFGDAEALALARSYLEFLRFAQREDGKFHNFCDYQGVFLDEEGSEDSFGRAIWACGYVVASPALDSEFKQRAHEILAGAFPNIFDLEHLRAQAFSALGLYYYLQSFPEANTARQAILALGQELVQAYQLARTEGWEWFEEKLTYCNARLPQALYLAHQVTGEKRFLEVAEKTTFFLLKNQVKDGMLLVVGNQGWFSRGGQFPLYDQQPVDAGCMVELLVTAYEVTGRKEYLELGERCFEWFMGRNIAGKMLCDPPSGACHDGLNKDMINPNQGAESTISYLLASLTLRKHLSELTPESPRLIVTEREF